ncbi:MAG: EF-hand domain-containing protein [Pseudomonadota bacterium]
MKAILTTTAASLLLLAVPAWAASEMDTDGDGNVTLEEVQAAMPEITAEMFASMDTDADGVLSDVEITAATEAGLLPS